MKPIDVDFKKIEITDYYAQLDQVKVRILFNDGKDKAIEKQISITDPSTHVAEWFSEIRQKLKDAHKQFTLDDHPLAGITLLRFKQEEDILMEKMAKFLAQARERIRSAKLAKLSYYDTEKKVKGFALNLG
jgi:hypothetical protein